MKKYSIILLAVLLLFSFVSCKDSGNTEDVAAEYEKKITEEQTKRESIVKNYEDFLLAKEFTYEGLWKLLSDRITAGDTTIDSSSDLSHFYTDEAKYFVTLADGETPDSGDLAIKSGSIKVENYSSDGPADSAYYNNKDLTFTDVVLTIKDYEVTAADGTKKTETKDVAMSGTFSVMNGINKVRFSVDMTVGDKTYKASWTFDTSESPWKYTAATVNGANVELRLLNQTDTPSSAT